MGGIKMAESFWERKKIILWFSLFLSLCTHHVILMVDTCALFDQLAHDVQMPLGRGALQRSPPGEVLHGGVAAGQQQSGDRVGVARAGRLVQSRLAVLQQKPCISAEQAETSPFVWKTGQK